jgi:hypothetical protein
MLNSLIESNLSPVVHQYRNDLYRVPLRRIKNHYRIYIADGFTREFDDNTLPDEIKTNITMILARSNQILRDHEISHLALMGTRDNELIDIGWQASDSWFVVVLPIKLLMRLRGEQNGDDT